MNDIMNNLLNNLYLKALVAALFLISGCTFYQKPTRSPANTELEYKIASYTPSQEEKFVLLGVPIEESFFSKDFTASGLCQRSFCFEGDDLSDFSPRYLIHFKKSQLSKVYSFTQEDRKLNYKLVRNNIRRSRRVFESRQRNPRKTPSLPFELLDVNSPKNYPLLRIVKYLTYSAFPFVGPSLIASERLENDRMLSDVSYLERMLKEIKKDRTQNLKNHLSEDDITDILISISVQYHPGGNIPGLFAKKDQVERRIQYQTYMANKEAKKLKNYAKIIDWANRTQTLIIPFSERFALVVWDKENGVNEKLIKRQNDLLGLNMNFNMEKVFKNEELNNLSPLGVIDFYHSDRPVDLIDFNDARVFNTQKKTSDLIDFFSGNAAQFIPLPFVQIALDISESTIKFVIRKQGKTIIEDRVRSYGELMAVIQLGAIDFPTNDLLTLFPEIKDMDELKGHLIEKVSKEQTNLPDKNTAIKRNGLRFEAYMSQRPSSNERIEFIPKSEDTSIERKMAQVTQSLSLPKREKKSPQATSRPVILFLIDGLSPQKLRYGFENGLFPTIREIFKENGRFLEAYTSRSITLPSWTTVLSGLSPDEHGTRSNSPIRTTSDTEQEDMIDFRKELILPNAIATSRSLQRLREAGSDWLPSYLEKGETVVNFMPLNDKNYPPVFSLTKKSLSKFSDLLYGSFQGTGALDETSAELTAKEIKNNPGKHKLVINWYASVDHHAHKANAHFRLLRDAKVNNPLYVIDQSIRKVLEAAKDDPVLKDAIVLLVSDHGQTGYHFHSNTTSLDLVRFFAGDYPQKDEMNFVIQSASSPDPDFDLTYLHEFFIQPFRAIYPKDHRRQGRSPNMLIDYSGDRHAQVYIRQGRWSLDKRMNFYEITNHSLGSLYEHLLGFELTNQENLKTGQNPKQKNPVLFMGQSLHDDTSIRELKKWLRRQGIDDEFERKPVIVKSRGKKTALLFAKKNTRLKDVFRYLVVANFEQDEYGRFSGEVADEQSYDPFNYNLSESERYVWRTDREWAALLRNEKYPTGIFSLIRTQTLSPRLNKLEESPWQSETPDFYLVANDEYSFNSSFHMEADHGGLLKNEVQTVLGVGSFRAQTINKSSIQESPFMLRDITPTVLEILGLEKFNSFTTGESFAPLVLENK